MSECFNSPLYLILIKHRHFTNWYLISQTKWKSENGSKRNTILDFGSIQTRDEQLQFGYVETPFLFQKKLHYWHFYLHLDTVHRFSTNWRRKFSSTDWAYWCYHQDFRHNQRNSNVKEASFSRSNYMFDIIISKLVLQFSTY
jgi:hypothetical protein